MLHKITSRDVETARTIIRQAANTNEFLRLLQDKQPTQCLDALVDSFTKIIYPFYNDCVIQIVMNDKLITQNITKLRKQLSEAEFAQEIFWAQKIAAGKAHYTDYPYMPRYRALLDSEQEYLCRIMIPDSKAFCFVGSGPMPISAFELKKTYPDVSMHGIEMDGAAIDLGNQVSLRSHVDISYTQSKAEDADFSTYDVVFVASMTVNKKEVLAQIARTGKNGTIIAVRSVEALRHMLYEPVALDMIPDGFASMGKTPFSVHHTNTTLFYRLHKNAL